MNDHLLILLRIVHIFASEMWIGTAISHLFFFKPAVKDIGPAGSSLGCVL